MTLDADKTIVARLAAIARHLEEAAGITPPPSLVHDFSVPAQLKRIEEALVAGQSAPTGSSAARTITFVVQDPENLKTHGGRATQSFPAWLNSTGFDLRLDRVFAVSDVDDYAFSLYASATDTDLGVAGDILLVDIACADDGTSSFSGSSTSFLSDTVADGAWLIFQHTSGSAETLTVHIEGTLV